ncbi:MAG: hypothetical protein ABJK28_17235 [Algibacter sp.]
MKLFRRYTPSISFALLPIFGLNISWNKSSKSNNLPEYKFFNLEQQGWRPKRITQFVNDINYKICCSG